MDYIFTITEEFSNDQGGSFMMLKDMLHLKCLWCIQQIIFMDFGIPSFKIWTFLDYHFSLEFIYVILNCGFSSLTKHKN